MITAASSARAIAVRTRHREGITTAPVRRWPRRSVVRPTRLTVLVAAVIAAGAGCTPKWTLRTAAPEIALQWPYQPRQAKVIYVRSLTGLARTRDSGAVVKALVFGADRDDPNAFVLPVAVATGPDGRIAVADRGRQCVHLFLPGEQRYLKLVGADREKMVSPVGLIFDEASALYVSDSAGTVFAFGADGALRSTVRYAGAERLQRPTGIAYSPLAKLLYVVDTLGNRVHAFATDGTLSFSFGGRGEAAGRFNYPTHIFRSAAGELYVTDSLNFRVQVFDEQGKVLGAFGHHGDGSGDLAMPKGIAVDRAGVVYVVDALFDNVQLFSRQGDFLLTLGKRGVDFGEFWLPAGAFINANDELYVCDTYNRRVQVFRILEQYESPLF